MATSSVHGRHALFAATLGISTPGIALAQTSPSSANPDPVTPAAATPSTSADATTTGATADAPSGFDANMFAPPGASSPTAAPTDDPGLRLQLFGDASFVARTDRSPWTLEGAAPGTAPQGASQAWNTFESKHLDLFFTTSTGHLDFLAEVMFEANEENEFGIDVERVQVTYLVANWLRVKAGRAHSAFGYYNDAYHHGTIFELTTGRPFLVNFEDYGGVFNPHLVGVMADGTVSLGRGGDLRYDLEVGNGRLPNITQVANSDALNNFKMVNLRLRWLPSFLDGLVIGFNGVSNEVPAMSATGGPNARPQALTELIAATHIAYMEHHAHILIEGALVHREEQGTGRAFDTLDGFVELGYSFGSWTPYARWESVRFSRDADPGWADSRFGARDARDVRDLRVGVNWHPNEHVAVKLEGRYLDVDGAVDTHETSGRLQLAFAF